MDQKFPVIGIALQSAKQVIGFKTGIGLTVGFFVIAAALFFALIWQLSGGDLSVFQTVAEGDMSRLPEDTPAGFVPLFLLTFVFFLVGYSWIFNLWIRYGALGAAGALRQNVGKSIGASFVTSIKLILIGILLAIVAGVALLLLVAVGVFSLEEAAQAIKPSLIEALVTNFVLLAVISSVYAVFSSNLTQTALGSDKEEVGPPHVFEFGQVLFLLNAVILLPLVFLELFASSVLAQIYNFVGSAWLTAAVPLAHGLRYDWQRQAFAGETAEEQMFGSGED